MCVQVFQAGLLAIVRRLFRKHGQLTGVGLGEASKGLRIKVLACVHELRVPILQGQQLLLLLRLRWRDAVIRRECA